MVGGSKIRVSRGKEPIVVPFVVTDRDGGATTGNLYVPAATGGRPYVKPGALIRVKPDGSYTGRLDAPSWSTPPAAARCASPPPTGCGPRRSRASTW